VAIQIDVMRSHTAVPIAGGGTLDLKIWDRYSSVMGDSRAPEKKHMKIDKTISLAFYTPPLTDPSWMNRFVANYSKYPFSHCELIFNDGMATSILSGGNIFFKRRTYASAHYTIKAMPVTHQSHERMYSFAMEQATKGVKFSNMAMLSPVFKWRVSSDSVGTFCSKYIAQVLQHGGVEWSVGIDPDYSTPATIYDAMSKAPNLCFNTVQYKLDRMNLLI
jgi:hypothetical protein